MSRNSGSNDRDERIVVVDGLPNDVDAIDVAALFCPRPGSVSLIKTSGGQRDASMRAFVSFFSVDDAVQALQAKSSFEVGNHTLQVVRKIHTKSNLSPPTTTRKTATARARAAAAEQERRRKAWQEREKERQERDARTVFVSKLPSNVTHDKLRAHFETVVLDSVDAEAGIESVRVALDLNSGASRGFAFVLFENKNDAMRAVEAGSTTIGEYEVKISAHRNNRNNNYQSKS